MKQQLQVLNLQKSALSVICQDKWINFTRIYLYCRTLEIIAEFNIDIYIYVNTYNWFLVHNTSPIMNPNYPSFRNPYAPQTDYSRMSAYHTDPRLLNPSYSTTIAYQKHNAVSHVPYPQAASSATKNSSTLITAMNEDLERLKSQMQKLNTDSHVFASPRDTHHLYNPGLGSSSHQVSSNLSSSTGYQGWQSSSHYVPFQSEINSSTPVQYSKTANNNSGSRPPSVAKENPSPASNAPLTFKFDNKQVSGLGSSATNKTVQKSPENSKKDLIPAIKKSDNTTSKFQQNSVATSAKVQAKMPTVASNTQKVQMERLKGQNKKLSSQNILAIQNASSEVTAQLDRARGQNKFLKQELDRTRALKSSGEQQLQSQISRLKQQLERTKRSFEEALQTKQEQIDSKKTLTKRNTLSSSHSVLPPLGSTATTSTSDLLSPEFLKNQLEILKAQYKQLKTAHAKQAENSRLLKSQLDKLNAQHALCLKKTNAAHDLNHQLQELAAINNRLQQDVLFLTNDNSRSKTQLEKLSRNNRSLEEQLSQANNHIEQTRIQMQTTLKQKTDLMTQLSQSRMQQITANPEQPSEQYNAIFQRLRDQKNSVLQQLKAKIDEVNTLKVQIAELSDTAKLQQEVAHLKDSISKLVYENETLKRLNAGGNDPSAQFDQILKMQLLEAQKFKEMLQAKNLEMQELREQLSFMKSKADNLEHQLDVQRVKMMSERKNMQTQLELERQNINYQVLCLRKTVRSLQTKIKNVVEDNNKKDDFMKAHLLGKAKEQGDTAKYIQDFFASIRIAVPKQNWGEIMLQEAKQIEELRKKLQMYEGVE